MWKKIMNETEPTEGVVLAPTTKDRIERMITAVVDLTGGVVGYALTQSIPGFLVGLGIAIVVTRGGKGIVTWVRESEVTGGPVYSNKPFTEDDEE